MHTNLLVLIGCDTQLRRGAATNGGEYAGSCPFCRCDLHGDAIDYLRHRDGISYREACDRLGLEPRRSRRNFQEEAGSRHLPNPITGAGLFLEVERPHPP